MEPTAYSVTELNRVKRVPVRGLYDHESVHSIIDSALICHVGFVSSQGPVVIPMFHARVGNSVVFHGATKSRLIQSMASGERICLSFGLVDGLVMAKSLFHHSMNYRSVVAYGSGRLVEGEAKRLEILKVMTDKIMPGRWDDAREPSTQEMKATAVVEIEIGQASAKVRTGGPNDDPEDLALPVWAGVIPMANRVGKPIEFASDSPVEPPPYLAEYLKRERVEN